jgi:hypothetical protein
MGDNMPYMLEKGSTLRLMERRINDLDRPARLAYLQTVRASEAADDLKWFIDGPPGLWADPAFQHKVVPAADRPWTGDKERAWLVRNWFGYQQVGGQWTKMPVGANPPTTGWWIAYAGNVDQILRRAVRWALELSLGLDHTGNAPTHDPPWPIELFWKCLAPWFEAWVVHRPTHGPGTGLVSLILITPTHVGANVAESPLATSALPVRAGGVKVPTTGRDYQVVRTDGLPEFAHAEVAGIPPPGRAYANWVVTHKDQVRSGEVTITDTARDRDLADWGIAQLGCYQGKGPVVVVSPSLAAGGVRHDGTVGP